MASPACCSVNSLSVKRFALFMLLVIVYASIFIGRLSDAGQVPGRRGCSGGRRALLALDEEVGEDPLPKKIKKSLVGEEAPVLKKRKVSAVEGSEEEKPKKKQASVEEVEQEKPKKKKASVEGLEEEKPKKKKAIVQDLEGTLPKKKKASVQDVEEEFVPKKKKAMVANEDQPLQVKKKAITKMEKVDEDQPVKKKKKTAIDEEDENQAIQNKKNKVAIDEDTQKKKTKSLAADGLEKPKKKMVLQEVEAETAEKPLKKKKLTSILNNDEVEEEPSTKKKSKIKNTEELPITLKTNKPTNKNLTTDAIKPAKPKQHKCEDADLISDFRDLPSKLATSIIPDLKRISTTSQVYLKKANKELSQSFKPLVGTMYASLIASFFSYLFLLAPIIIFPILYARIRNYFLPLQTIVVFTQIYLAIYFAVLALSVVITGQEPLRFFYATSKASFLYTQLLQTLGYALFLLVLVVYLVVVFSSKDSSGAARAVALAQMVVGLVVGAHYYVAVAHRAVLREPPLTNWKVHSGYAALFVGVCVLARAERRKKAYLHDGGEESKTS